MNHYGKFSSVLASIVGNKNVYLDEPMKKHTSFKVGGPADILVTPETFEQVVDVIKFCHDNNIIYYIVGNGSNLLVKDGGIRGIVIKLSKLNNISIDDDTIIAESGACLSLVSVRAMKSHLTGLEFACGIPGSVGGALTMNAGAYNGEMADVVQSSVVISEDGEIKTISGKDLELGYRMSAVLNHDYTVLNVKFKLEHGDYDKIKARVDNLTRRRRERQPLEYPSAGSTFKRPEGHFAAKLIEDSGLKGRTVGGAQVSSKHSGFIINKDNATAKDILDLIEVVQKTVKEKYDVDLHTEVRIIGED